MIIFAGWHYKKIFVFVWQKENSKSECNLIFIKIAMKLIQVYKHIVISLVFL